MSRARFLLLPLVGGAALVAMLAPRAEATRPCGPMIVEYPNRQFTVVSFEAIPLVTPSTPLTQEEAGWKGTFIQSASDAFDSPGIFEGNTMGALVTRSGGPTGAP